jgi:hypothetical protein
MKTLFLIACLVAVGGALLHQFKHSPEHYYSKTAAVVQKSFYEGHAAVGKDFTRSNPAHSMSLATDGKWTFRGTAYVAAQGALFVDRWQAVYDPARDLVESAESLGSIDPAAPPALRAGAQIGTPPSDGPQHSGRWVSTRDAAGNYRSRELKQGVSYMQSIGGGGNFRDSSAATTNPKAPPRTMLDQPAHR